jgi:lipid-A-disaccharide synthase-like uncharacterized protein
MREWGFVLAPVVVLSYFVMRPDQLGVLVELLGRFVH